MQRNFRKRHNINVALTSLPTIKKENHLQNLWIPWDNHHNRFSYRNELCLQRLRSPSSDVFSYRSFTFFPQAKVEKTEETFFGRLAETLENLIIKKNHDTIAAMIAEPIQGADRLIIPPKQYF